MVALTLTVVRNPESSGGSHLLFPLRRISSTATTVVGALPVPTDPDPQERAAPQVQLRVDPASLILGGQTEEGVPLLNPQRRLVARTDLVDASTGESLSSQQLPFDIRADYDVLQGASGEQALSADIFSGRPTLRQAVVRSSDLLEGSLYRVRVRVTSASL